MSKIKKQKQPVPPKGKVFYGWTVFNWGIQRGEVFRTRKDAKKAIEIPWEEAKSHFMIVKVKCETI